ncbi:MAG: GTPase ObgE [Patescibacteria group bacterium]|jgi:GTP-binding protein
MLTDKARITVVAGKGGDGKVSFLHEKYRPHGGPDGGNGGNGGAVYVTGINDIRYLKKYKENPYIHGNDGVPGGSDKCTGANGEDIVIKVPFGTRVTNLTTKEFVEIFSDTEEVLLVKGGRGGKGNWEFRSAINQVPMEFEPGKPGEEKKYELELMLIADVGLIGVPNVGKSSLLNALTKANAQVADYNFTTLEPNLGTLSVPGNPLSGFGTENKIVLADIPGLIEGASQGRGLGFHFLKHIERTHLLVHCVSCTSDDPVKDYETVRNELGAFDKRLLDIPEILLFTKADELDDKQKKEFAKKVKKISKKPEFISIIDDKSLEKLKDQLIRNYSTD